MKSFIFWMAVTAPTWANHYGTLPLSFEANDGQTDARVKFLSRSNGRTLFLTSTEAVIETGHSVFQMQLKGANADSRAAGEDRQTAKSNYFIGSDPRKWRTDVANYSRIRFTEVYAGIDLVYYGRDRQLEYDWIVKPGADPAKIRLKFAGDESVRIDRNGDLVIATPSGEIRQKKPVIYQANQIAGRYVIRGRHEAGFEIGPYDKTEPLVIDPVLVFSSFLGGSAIDQGNAIAVDSNGNAYVTGWTNSTDFPTVSPAQSTNQGGTKAGSSCPCDAFVSKVSADGSTLLYSTYLGGTGVDYGTGIAVDSTGHAFVTGWTQSTDFPVLNAYQPTYGSLSRGFSAFVTKLSPAGNSLAFSTYLGGNTSDIGDGIALDSAGNAYITGTTNSSNFPTTPGAIHGGPNPSDLSHAYVTKMSSDGSTLLYSTFLSAAGTADGVLSINIAVDPNGFAYVDGYTAFQTYPTFNSIQSTFSGSYGAFVSKINQAGSAYVYSTFVNGTGGGRATAIAADSSGNAYITGYTSATDYPTVNAPQPHLAGSANAFVTKLNSTGSALLYSTYLGGSGVDIGYGIAVDSAGAAWVSGQSASSNFPLVSPLANTHYTLDSLFVTKLNANGSALLFSSYVAAVGSYQGKPNYPGGGIAVDGNGNAYATGGTSSTLPVVNAFQPNYGGTNDAFVLKIGTAASTTTVANDFAGNGRAGALLYDPTMGQSYTGLSNGNGSYTYVPNLFTSGFDTLRTGDFNGDHKADLVVYNSHNSLAYIGMGNGDGTFTFQSLFWSPGYTFVETGDLNGDGKTDFALYNSATGTMYTGISNGDGTFTYKYTLITSGYSYLRLADFTGDGKADIFVYNVVTGAAYLGVGDGTGGFAFHPLSVSSGYNLVDVGDLNGDGKADIILYNSTNGNAATGISDGLGGLTFTPALFSPGFTSLRLADYTGDGKADVTLYNENTAAAYFGTGTGTGSFTFQSLFWSAGYDIIVAEDVNGDGKSDVQLYNSSTGTEYTGISNGNGTFTYTYSLWGPNRVLAR